MNVWDGIRDDEEFILVNSIVLLVGFTVHMGKSVIEVPINCAHDAVTIPLNDTYDGKRMRNLPLDDNPSLIVTFKV